MLDRTHMNFNGMPDSVELLKLNRFFLLILYDINSETTKKNASIRIKLSDVSSPVIPNNSDDRIIHENAITLTAIKRSGALSDILILRAMFNEPMKTKDIINTKKTNGITDE